MYEHDKFTLVKRGYDPVSVDAYVDSVQLTMRSYSDKEATINKAIIRAQESADAIIAEARQEAADIISRAKSEASDMRKTYGNQMYEITNLLNTQKQLLQSIQQDYDTTVTRFLRTIEENNLSTIMDKITAMENSVAEFMS
ncbi:MAG: hypothetical protein FWC89_04295 [Defluviitaleaceae bacterium]|nr:hypothetical protein [Defluviitaleaceae bacterium]